MNKLISIPPLSRLLSFTDLIIAFGLVPNRSSWAATSIEVADPASVGMSAERLARLSTVTQAYIDQGLVSGTVTLVARQGKVVHLEAQGYQDVKTKAPMSPSTIFGIASMTKPITSVALMMLWEEGLVLLSDPVEDYLPEFAGAMVSSTGDVTGETGTLERPKSKMTLRQLLTHTSGLASSEYQAIVD